jgi:hypothetical protein
MINNVNEVNERVAQNDLCVSHRTNLAFLPRFLHSSVPIGLRSMQHLKATTDATDVQLSIVLLRESLNKARSVTVQLARLNPFLATPSNLQDAIDTFTRKASVACFLRGRFKFMSA